MTPQEIKDKSAELAAFYVAKANGKILEYDTKSIGWVDNGSTSGPDMQSDLTRWRVKPEPRTFWVLLNQDGEVIDATQLQTRVFRWSKSGCTVIETKEALP